MNTDDARNQIHNLLDLRTELSRYGGAEEAPTIWHDYVTRRSLLFKQFGLPETTVNFQLLDPTPISGIERRRIYRAGLDNDNRLGEIAHLKDILLQAGITGLTEDTPAKNQREPIVTMIFDRLSLRGKNLQSFPRPTQMELLEYGIESKIPARDLLLLLGYFNEPYQRFLINTILYGGYGSAIQVLEELKVAQDLINVWAFVELYSDFLWERQLGADNMKSSGLRFIDSYLWWEMDFVI